jgi:hypothetical protein
MAKNLIDDKLRYKLDYLKHLARRAGVLDRWKRLLNDSLADEIDEVFNGVHEIPASRGVISFEGLRGCSMITLNLTSMAVSYTPNWKVAGTLGAILYHRELKKSHVVAELKAILSRLQKNSTSYNTVLNLINQYKKTDPECLTYTRDTVNWECILVLDDV